MSRKNARVIPICLFLVIWACSASLQPSRTGTRPAEASDAVDYLKKAAELEQKGELQPALLAWHVASLLYPEDKSVSDAIKRLEQNISGAAQANYRKGVQLYDRGDEDGARRAFLTALRLQPGHKTAMYYIKVLMNRNGQKVYKVKPGDSLIKIARTTYNDSTKAYLIAYFNGLNPERTLYVDETLLLPQLTVSQVVPRRDVDALVKRANEALDRKQYQKVHSLSEKIESLIPGNSQAIQLNDAAYYGEGKALMEKKDYLAALERFKQMSEGHEGRKRAIAMARAKSVRQADEEKFELAQSLFKKRDYAGTINICDELLAKKPGSRQARALSDAAYYALGKQYVDQGKMDKAIDTLKHLDINYHDTAQLMTQAQGQLNARAEALYRKGVRYFLNEELEAAIDAWEKTLALNPEHPKAKQDIENAMRLLDKWRGLDEKGATPDEKK